MGYIKINDDLAREMAAFAEAQGLSIDAQAEEWLRQALRRSRTVRDVKAMFADIAAMSPAGAVQTDSVDLLREVRNR